ncbi:MAG: NAD-dependent epimerase/dehydratase family protein [Bacteroidales bacterium]|jgi:nucleoside-diphosphate-sugar epimerase|nr:NAD-dependent epimerase/dehydratase family protein [Bacteroidales bacterium]
MILVTGGTGLLGSHLLFDLVQSGKPVRAIKRKNSDTNMVAKIFSYYIPDARDLASEIQWVEADLLDFGAMEDALEGITEIYHAGAVVSFYPKDHKAMLKVNIEGTANLVNQAIDHKVEKFCYVSSVATMGRAENNGLTSEETYWVTSRKNSVYSISKYGAEREVWRGMEEGLKAVIINPSVILGPGFWNDNSGLFRLVWEGLKYYTQGVNGYVDVRDIVKAMTGLMDNNIFGQRFICSSENVSYKDFFTMIAKYLHKPAPSVNVPMALTSLAWRVETIRAFLTGSKPEVTREMAITTTQKYTYTHEKLCQTLNFKFRPVEESIREICGFFLQDHEKQPTGSGSGNDNNG